MKKILLTFAGPLIVFASSAFGQIIVNGGFELNPVVPPPNYHTYLPTYNDTPSALPGWDVLGPLSDPPPPAGGSYGGVDLQNNSQNFVNAFEGNQYLDLIGWGGTSDPTGHGISQEFSIGAGTYQLQFVYTGYYQALHDVDISISGAGISFSDSIMETFTSSTIGDWVQYSNTFTSSGGIATLSFISQNIPGTNGGLYLDDVQIIPEPSTYALIFGGLILGVVIFRRKLGQRGPVLA